MQVTDETRRILEKAGLSAPGLKGSVLQSDASQFQANLLKSQDRVILWSRYIELISIY
jgi:predicted transcriptional regulator